MRIVITGMGMVTPYGMSLTETMYGLNNQHDSINHTIPLKIAKNKEKLIEVKLVPCKQTSPDIPKSFDFTEKAVNEALVRAGLNEKISDKDTTIGVAITSTAPSINVLTNIINQLEDEPRLIKSSTLLSVLNNSIATHIAHKFGCKGPCISSSAACAGGLQSIFAGIKALERYEADIMICGASEEYSDLLAFMFHKLGIISNECKPFASDRNGTIISEGTGIVILERERHALNRNAKILATIDGYATSLSTNIAFSDTESIYKSMCVAGLCPLLRGLPIIINAHATGTFVGDETEQLAIEQTAKTPRLKYNTVTYKQYFGHTMAASGVIELIASIEQTKKLEYSLNIYSDDETLKLMTEKERNKLQIKDPEQICILKNSFGLGGTNASLFVIVDRYS